MTQRILDRLESFYDAVPRHGARVEEHGPLRLFVQDGGPWPYYARPSPGGGTVSADDVLVVRARQRELGVPEAFEWVEDATPLARAATEAGLVLSAQDDDVARVYERVGFRRVGTAGLAAPPA